MMGPTEILSRQHYLLAKELFKDLNIKIEYLSENRNKKRKEYIKTIKGR